MKFGIGVLSVFTLGLQRVSPSTYSVSYQIYITSNAEGLCEMAVRSREFCENSWC